MARNIWLSLNFYNSTKNYHRWNIFLNLNWVQQYFLNDKKNQKNDYLNGRNLSEEKTTPTSNSPLLSSQKSEL